MKNIVLESYNKLFLEQPELDHTRLQKEYIETLVDDAINEEFEDGVVVIAGYKLTPSKCLKMVDPLAYNEYFQRYCESQELTQNDDGTYYDHMDEQFSQSNQPDETLVKECCHCCGNEFLKQELDPETGYCFSCQEDELTNGPAEFLPDENDTEDILIIKQSCMKRWCKTHKK